MKIGEKAFVVKSGKVFEATLKEVVSKDVAIFQRVGGAKKVVIQRGNVYSSREEAIAVNGESKKPVDL